MSAKTMAIVGVFVAAFVAGLFFARWSARLPERPASEAPAATAVMSLQVEGMTCEACAEAVRQALLKLPAVQEVRVSLEESRVEVVYDAARMKPDRLRTLCVQAIQKAGYRVS